jgi:hypothetical protein
MATHAVGKDRDTQPGKQLEAVLVTSSDPADVAVARQENVMAHARLG